ncbi:hypothetical protein [Pseudomonas sp. LFM046]|uniref:hypothetical protein n=1 Tax=Pseudomonas sp. LFM046 TaxID=1608357 RepID=UPI0005CFD221|nr:hypothetical protein [Pseudomonas sp. LFM046]
MIQKILVAASLAIALGAGAYLLQPSGDPAWKNNTAIPEQVREKYDSAEEFQAAAKTEMCKQFPNAERCKQ